MKATLAIITSFFLLSACNSSPVYNVNASHDSGRSSNSSIGIQSGSQGPNVYGSIGVGASKTGN